MKMGAGGSVPSSETDALALGYTPEQITAYMEAQSPAKSSSRSISPQGSPGAAPDKSKMSFLGAPGSGKSSLITRFMGNGFNAAMETKALQYHSKNLKDGTLRLQVCSDRHCRSICTSFDLLSLVVVSGLGHSWSIEVSDSQCHQRCRLHLRNLRHHRPQIIFRRV